MKKESINTFNEGLIYDLNPLTTPSNVLTDCVNGTFITFNGDELALQTDAGNTKILVPGTEEDPQYVQLSPGFYPIGIKEYGGILYIVSAKKPDPAILFSESGTYNLGDRVYTERLGETYYFESLANNNSSTLPYESNSNWLFVGIEKDYINKYGSIEFGSYPSPILLNETEFNTSKHFECLNEEETNAYDFKFDLYSPQIINDSIFQAGVYATFFRLRGTTINTTNISYKRFQNTAEWVDNPERKIFNVKLYHQLTNGFIDLTNDVWQKYAEFIYDTTGVGLNSTAPTSTPKFWFNDVDFKYYCPHNYKGKLVMSVELEALDTFSLNPLSIIPNGANYDITFSINFENTTNWMDIAHTYINIAYTIDGSIPNLEIDATGNTILSHSELTMSGNIGTFVLSLDITENQGKVIKYKIVPEFSWDGDVYAPQSAYLPQIFIDQHTLSGSELIITKYDDFIIFRDILECDPVISGAAIYHNLVLKDSFGFIDNELNTSVEPFAFFWEGADPPVDPPGSTDPRCLGYYTITSENKAQIISFNEPDLTITYKDYIKNLVEDTQVRVANLECTPLVTLTIQVNKDFGWNIPITVKQYGISLTGTKVIGVDLTYQFQVQSGVSFIVDAKNRTNGVTFNPWITNYSYSDTITADTSIKFGIVTSVYMDHQCDLILPEINPCQAILYTALDATSFGPDLISEFFNISCTNRPDLTINTTRPLRTQWSTGSTTSYWASSSPVPLFEIVFDGISTTIYENLAQNFVIFSELGTGHIFEHVQTI